MPTKSSLILLLVCSALASCSKKEEKSTDLVTFPLKGEVVAMDTAKMRITLDHEEIPNYMMAMTMPFKIKNRALFDGVQIGDTIQGVLAVSRTESWLETFTVVGKGEPPSQELVEGTLLAKVFRTGDAMPNDPLINQDEKPVRFSDYRGKAVAVTFIYTRCPLPDFCIRMSDQFAKLQKALKQDKSMDGKWQLVTVSFDPAFDTPKVLKEYGKTYGADFAVWDFVTAEMPVIMKFADGLGLTMADDEGLIAHNLRTVLLDQEGKIVRVINGNEWTGQEVADEMKNIVE
ncbi:MAG: SCO family protein [Bacteroidota bacterium]